MARYTINFVRLAREELEALGTKIIKRILAKIEALAWDPRPRGCHKLRGEKHLWRIRVGDYRVIYFVYDESCSVEIISVRHRSEAYR